MGTALEPATERPAYTAGEAARYAQAAPSTARRWLDGYTYSTRVGPRVAPPVASHRAGDRFLTFEDLVEVAAIAAAIREGVTLRRVRAAVDYARELFKVGRPLLLERFLTDGRDLYLHELDVKDEVDRHLNASTAGQMAFPYIAEVLRHLDYDEDGKPYRWWPRGRDGAVLVDPRIAFGQPVLARTGIRTDTVLDRFMAGESIDEIADEYDLTAEEVQEGVRFENRTHLIAG
jgi:uncharacterized protein (DUF433 family)